MVPDDLIRDVLETIVDVGRAADCLVEPANGRGGMYNISVVLVRVVEALRRGGLRVASLPREKPRGYD